MIIAAALQSTTTIFDALGATGVSEERSLDRHWRNARTHTLHDSVRWKYHAVGQYALNDLLCDPFTYAHPYSPVAG